MLNLKKEEEVISGNQYLFLIGINEYLNAHRLFGSVNGVNDLEKVLIGKYQFNEMYVNKLLNEKATKANILEVFRSLVSKLTENDSLFIFFSGHGTNDKEGKGYWVPYDGGLSDNSDIDHETIASYIRAMKAKHVILLSDSMFSSNFIFKQN